MSTLILKEFDWNKLTAGKNILCSAKRGGGKTTLELFIMYKMHDQFDVVLGCCPTVINRELMKRHVPNAFVFSDLEESIVQQAIDIVNYYAAKGKKIKVCLWVDDCGFNASVFKSMPMKYIFSNGRHNDAFTLIVGLQWITTFNPESRAQIDLTFVFKEPIASNREKIRNLFFGSINSREEFDMIHNEFTENYGFIVQDNNAKSNNIEDEIFWGRAPKPEDIPDFKACRPSFWQLSELFHRVKPPMMLADPIRHTSRPARITRVVKDTVVEEVKVDSID